MVAGCHVQPEQFFNLIFGYNTSETKQASIAGTGGNVIALGDVVPAGEVWLLTLQSARHNDTTARNTWLVINDADNGAMYYQILASQPSTQTNVVYPWVLLEEGDSAQARFDALAVGKTGYLIYHVIKMKVSQ